MTMLSRMGQEWSWIWLVLPYLIVGCQTAPLNSDHGGTVETSRLELTAADSSFVPGYYEGMLPCASCPGIETQIVFLEDETYRHRSTHLATDDVSSVPTFEMGRWSVTIGGLVVLRSNAGAVMRFLVETEDGIRLTDQVGSPIDSDTNRLILDDAGEFDFGPARLSGMYTYFADAAIFKPCNTALTIPVAMVEQHVELERAYLAERAYPGAPLWVRLDAKLADFPGGEGDRMQESLVVTDFVEVAGSTSCLNAPSLTDSLGWIATEIDGRLVEPRRQSMEPTLAFTDSTVTGFTGCNRLVGPANVDDDGLRFGILAVTRRACPDTLESTFLRLLETVDSYRIIGNQLELRSNGLLVALLTHGAIRHTI